MPTIAVLGARGHTGRLVVPALEARGAKVLAFGRGPGALPAADAKDKAALDRALRDADGVVNLAGPFLAVGTLPVEAALDRGIPYVDSTGEQAFMLDVRHRYHDRAERAGVAIVNACAYEYALGDLLARAHLPEGGRALHVLYRNRGAGASAGTKKTILRVTGAPSYSWEDGRLQSAGAARHRRVFETPEGPRDAMSFAGGEVLTVPRHTPFRTVRTYVPAPPSRIPVVRALAPLLRVAMRGPVLRAAERAVDRRHRPPQNEKARAEVHLVSEGPDRRVVARIGDPYAFTAHMLAVGILRLVGSSARGVLAPAEAFDARAALDDVQREWPHVDVSTAIP